MTLLIVIVVAVVLLGAPGYYWYGRPGVAAPGYAPGGLLGIIVLLVVLYLLFGHGLGL